MRPKLASSRRPRSEDFSGWNCTAKTLPDATAAANVVPYSHSPTIAELSKHLEAKLK